MKKILVLFGSQSDEYVYSDLIKSLEADHKVDFEVISAHRDPQKLKDRLDKDDFDLIVAGAGLAAHLPGVCASLTKKPVFGTPVSANFGGLDALLSILQMPFGIPVGTFLPNSVDSLIALINELDSKTTKEISVVLSNDIDNHEYANAEFDRLSKYAIELGIKIIKNDTIDKNLMNIVLVHRDYKHEVHSNAVYIPLMTNSDKNSPTSGIRTMDIIGNGGVWFGVNNSRNALLFLNKFL